MKRWKTKNDKRLIGGLLILLAMASLPWVDRNELYNGFSILSSEETSESQKAFDENIQKGVGSISADDMPAKPKAQESDKKVAKPVEKKEALQVKEDVKPQEKAVVASKEQTEAIVCVGECASKKSASGAPAEKDTLAILMDRMNDLAKRFTNKEDSESKKRKDRRDDDWDDEDDRRSDDLVEKACNRKGYRNKENSYYTTCAMQELARLAKLSNKDKRPTSNEMTELIEDHIYHNLLEVMKEGMSAEATSTERSEMRKLDRELERLIEKLAGSRYTDARKKLSEIKRLAINDRVRETNSLLTEANALATMGDFAGASLMLNEFQNSRVRMSGLISTDLHDMRDVYTNMIGVDGFSRSRATAEFRNLYMQPYNSVNNRLWSGNPTWDYGTQGGGNRTARAGGGYDSAFPRAPGIRGGTQQGGANYGPPVAGQRAQLGPNGSVGPVVNNGQQYSGHPAANNWANGSNHVQGPGRFNAPYNNGLVNNWTNNVNPWTAQAGINGAWGGQRVGSPGIASPGIGGYGAGFQRYSGYPLNVYSPAARPPYAPGWQQPGVGGFMQPGFYSSAPARF